MRGYILLSVATLSLLASGCRLGPPSLRASRSEYNRAIQRTADEQLLLNLVRLKYRDTPLFLEVGSVSAQFVFGKSADVGGRIVENVGPSAPDILDLGAVVAYEERPTITYSPLQGKEFVERVMSPLTIDTIMLLYYSGWKIDRILRLTVQRINGVENAMRAASPTPGDVPPDADFYARFTRVTEQLWELQKLSLLDMGYEEQETTVSQAIVANRVRGTDLVAAAQQDYRFHEIGDSGQLALFEKRRVPVLWLTPEALDRAETREFVETFRLVPGKQRYKLKPAFAAQPTGKDGRFEELAVGTRALVGTMFYLSQAVEVPRSHIEKGLVTDTRAADGQPFDWAKVTDGLFRVHCTLLRPARAAVAIRYRGYWFYIDDADQTSKSTFALLGQLFRLQAGGAKAVEPVLTLPVGG